MTTLPLPTIDLSNNNIKAYDTENYRYFLAYIEDFCTTNNINFKFVGESITIYPADYSLLNPDRINLSEVYIRLLAWNEKINWDIDSMYWIDVEEEINSLDDLEKFLFKVHNTTQVAEAYTTEIEKQETLDKRAKELAKYEKKEEKRKNKFSKKCKKLGVSENDFMTLLEAYKDSHNKHMWV